MAPDRRDFPLSKDQPILRRARKSSQHRQRPGAEADFWLLFDLDKFARDWPRSDAPPHLSLES